MKRQITTLSALAAFSSACVDDNGNNTNQDRDMFSSQEDMVSTIDMTPVEDMSQPDMASNTDQGNVEADMEQPIDMAMPKQEISIICTDQEDCNSKIAEVLQATDNTTVLKASKFGLVVSPSGISTFEGPSGELRSFGTIEEHAPDQSIGVFYPSVVTTSDCGREGTCSITTEEEFGSSIDPDSVSELVVKIYVDECTSQDESPDPITVNGIQAEQSEAAWTFQASLSEMLGQNDFSYGGWTCQSLPKVRLESLSARQVEGIDFAKDINPL